MKKKGFYIGDDDKKMLEMLGFVQVIYLLKGWGDHVLWFLSISKNKNKDVYVNIICSLKIGERDLFFFL